MKGHVHRFPEPPREDDLRPVTLLIADIYSPAEDTRDDDASPPQERREHCPDLYVKTTRYVQETSLLLRG